MSKRVLILCEAIAPPAYSPRVVTLVEWLQGRGWQCVLITEECAEQAYHTDICPIYQMPVYSNILADKLFYGKDKALYEYAKEVVDVRSFDVIFCSSYYYFPLYAASLLAEEYGKPLLVDLRDIAEQWGNVPYFTRKVTSLKKLDYWIGKAYERRQLRGRNTILRKAKVVTTVSPWHREVLAQYNPNTHLIYNGYDAEVFVPKDIKSEQFCISYLGKLYSTSLRDPRLLFAAMEQLVAQGAIDSACVRVTFHIDLPAIPHIQALGEKYHITDILDVSGYVARQDILPIMHSSSILLVLTTLSTDKGTHGIMGTKFFENIGVEKPILCVRSDEECLADAIERTNAGLAAREVEEVKAFILDKYKEWQKNGYTRQAVKDKEQFTRQKEAQQFEELLLECIK